MVETKKAVTSNPKARSLQRKAPGMKKFIARLLGFGSIQILVSLVFIVPYLQRYDQAVSQGFMAASIEKQRLLQDTSQPRLILVGGSSVGFGMNSPYLKKQFSSYRPINMGIHAGLGAEFMLNEVKPSLRSGDVVVVSLEYETFDAFPPDPKQVIDSLEARKENLAFLPLNYVPALLDKGLVQLGGFLRRSSTLIQTGEVERLPYYARSGFNQYGDIVAHYSLPDDTQKLSGEGRYYRFKPENIQRTIQAMNDFAQFCRSRNVRVFFYYPPLMPKVLNMNRSEIGKVETALTQSLQFPLLGNPNQVAYSDDYYFDTRYHLNQRGVQRRTKDLVDYLLPYLSRQN